MSFYNAGQRQAAVQSIDKQDQQDQLLLNTSIYGQCYEWIVDKDNDASLVTDIVDYFVKNTAYKTMPIIKEQATQYAIRYKTALDRHAKYMMGREQMVDEQVPPVEIFDLFKDGASTINNGIDDVETGLENLWDEGKGAWDQLKELPGEILDGAKIVLVIGGAIFLLYGANQVRQFVKP